MLLVLAVVLTFVILGLRVYKHATERRIKIMSLSILLSLISYFVHGIMNNFLDSDKASVPVWGLIAALVALDLYVREKEMENNQNSAQDVLKS
jgi:hypothetical protein